MTAAPSIPDQARRCHAAYSSVCHEPSTMVLSTRFSAREKCACVKVFALCIAAVSLVKSDAENFVAVLLHKIGSFDLLCSPIAWRFVFARLCALLAFLSSGVALH